MTADSATGTRLDSPRAVLETVAAAVAGNPASWPGQDAWVPGGAAVDGWTDDTWVYVSPPAWARLTGRPGADVLSVLCSRGDLAVPETRRARGEWTSAAPRWANRAPSYKIRLSALAAAETAPDLDPADMPARPVPGAGKFRAGPWADSDPAPALAEPCPQCAAPAARTPQGTLTDCPACGLVLTTACQDRITKAEDTAGRTTASAQPAVPDLAGQWQLAAVERARQRKRGQVVSLYRAWARAVDPAGLDGQLAVECAGLCDGLNAAADLAATVPDLAALARFHADIGRGLIRDARDMHAEVQAARSQDDDDDYPADVDHQDDDDDYPADDDDYPADVDHQDDGTAPALRPGPRCGRCGQAAAVAQVDTANPAHRYATGLSLPVDVCMACLAALRATVSGYTFITLRVTRAYAGPPPLALAPAPRPATGPGPGPYPVMWPGARPGPPPPGMLRPSAVSLATRTARPAPDFRREKLPQPACENRAAHPIRVILGNAMPAARARVTMTSRAGRTSIMTCGPECTRQATAILGKTGTGTISVEAI